MSAQFNSAGSTRLDVTPTLPITSYPFTIGMWALSTTIAAGTGNLWSISRASSAGSGNFSGSRTTANWAMWDSNATATAGTIVANRWDYLLYRFNTATNRRLTVLQGDGTIASAQQTTNRTFPTLTDHFTLGAVFQSNTVNQFHDGCIAEFFYTLTDIQSDGAATQESLIRQLAYGGPYSIPYLEKDVIEYRKFFSTLGGDVNKQDEVAPMKGAQAWANTGVVLGPHPPLPYWYEKPVDIARNLIV